MAKYTCTLGSGFLEVSDGMKCFWEFTFLSGLEVIESQ